MNQESRKPVAISYSRFSSKGQRAGTSIERQMASFASWHEQNQQYEVRAFQDHGVSAFKGRNSQKGSLAKLLQLIESGGLKNGDCLVIEAMDRLSRQEPIDSITLVLDILKSGVQILTLENNIVYTRDSVGRAEGYILLANLQAAHSYSKRLGERVSVAHKSKRAKARAKELPSKLVTASWIKDGRLLEPFAALVKRAVGFYLKGLGHRAIVKELQPIIDADPILKKRYVRPLHATTVKRWLQSPELVGDWESKDGLIAGVFDPLISHLEFDRVQTLLKQRSVKPSKQTAYLLSGLIKCRECGGSFHTRIQKPKPSKSAPIGSEAYKAKPKILYCNCGNYLKNGNCENNTTWPYEVLYSVLMVELPGALYEIERNKPVPSGDAEKIQNDIAELEARKKRYASLFAKLGDEVYLDMASADKESIEKLKGKLYSERTADVQRFDLGLFSQGLNSFFALDEIQQNLMLRRLNLDFWVQAKKAWRMPPEDQSYELVRRSQKHGVYIVNKTKTDKSGKIEEHFYAVDKLGRSTFFSRYRKESDLLKALESLKNDAERRYLFRSFSEAQGVSQP